MARVARLTQTFLTRRIRILSTNPNAAPHLSRAVAAIATANELPGRQDARVVIAPVQPAYVRRVPRCNVWIYYDLASNDEVVFLTVTDTPPPPSID